MVVLIFPCPRISWITFTGTPILSRIGSGQKEHDGRILLHALFDHYQRGILPTPRMGSNKRRVSAHSDTFRCGLATRYRATEDAIRNTHLQASTESATNHCSTSRIRRRVVVTLLQGLHTKCLIRGTLCANPVAPLSTQRFVASWPVSACTICSAFKDTACRHHTRFSSVHPRLFGNWNRRVKNSPGSSALASSDVGTESFVCESDRGSPGQGSRKVEETRLRH